MSRLKIRLFPKKQLKGGGVEYEVSGLENTKSGRVDLVSTEEVTFYGAFLEWRNDIYTLSVAAELVSTPTSTEQLYVDLPPGVDGLFNAVGAMSCLTADNELLSGSISLVDQMLVFHVPPGTASLNLTLTWIAPVIDQGDGGIK